MPVPKRSRYSARFGSSVISARNVATSAADRKRLPALDGRPLDRHGRVAGEQLVAHGGVEDRP
jgi:hypothetical protein